MPTKLTDFDTSDSPPIKIEDTTIVAFLKLRGYAIVPFLYKDDKEDPRVSFGVQGDKKQIEIEMSNFFKNASVGIQDYCRCLKDVKSAMYNLKRISRENNRQ